MPTTNARHVVFSTQAVNATISMVAIYGVVAFCMLQWNKNRAKRLLIDGVKATAVVIKNYTRVDLSPHNSRALPMLEYQFTDELGKLVTNEIKAPIELKNILKDDVFTVIYNSEKPSQNYPEILLQHIASGKVWRLGFRLA